MTLTATGRGSRGVRLLDWRAGGGRDFAAGRALLGSLQETSTWQSLAHEGQAVDCAGTQGWRGQRQRVERVSGIERVGGAQDSGGGEVHTRVRARLTQTSGGSRRRLGLLSQRRWFVICACGQQSEQRPVPRPMARPSVLVNEKTKKINKKRSASECVDDGETSGLLYRVVLGEEAHTRPALAAQALRLPSLYDWPETLFQQRKRASFEPVSLCVVPAWLASASTASRQSPPQRVLF